MYKAMRLRRKAKQNSFARSGFSRWALESAHSEPSQGNMFRLSSRSSLTPSGQFDPSGTQRAHNASFWVVILYEDLGRSKLPCSRIAAAAIC